MATFSIELWIVLALIAGVSVLNILGRIAQAIEDEKSTHNAHIGAEKLRRHYAAQLAALKAHETIIEVDAVEEEPLLAPPAEAA